LIVNNDSHITFVDPNNAIKNSAVINESIQMIQQTNPNNISMMEERIMKKDFLSKQDIMLISLENWKNWLILKAFG